MKHILQRLFYKLKQPREWDINCNDCQTNGRVVMPSRHQLDLPDGWRLVWVRLKPIYICDKCLAKRREWAKQFLEGKT